MEKLLLQSTHFFYVELTSQAEILKCNQLFEDDLPHGGDKGNLYALVRDQDHDTLRKVLSDCMQMPGDSFKFEMVFAAGAEKSFMVNWEMCACENEPAVRVKAIGQKREYDSEIWDYIENHKLTQQHYQSLFDQTADAVCSFDPLGTFITGNKSLETITGYKLAELKDVNIQRLFHPRDHVITEPGFQAAANGTMKNYEVRIVTKLGKIRYCNVTNLPIVLNNLVFGVYVIAQDITDKVLAERKIKRDRDLMQHVQNELHVAVQELTDTNKDLRQFTYITSHNLRSPLSNLISILDLVDRRLLDAYNLGLFEMFHQTTQQLFNAVSDLMEILVIKNKLNVETEPVMIDKLLGEVIQSISTAVEGAHCQINTSFPVSEVYFNRTYLESILLNLLTNAIKYKSPHRQPVINVVTQDTPDYVVLTFADNGIGIDMERHQEKVFGLYQRFHTNADSKGLGLFIVKSQVIALGGKIEVKSKVDVGTTFTLYFKK